ncbi:hypothetical protein Bpfe_012122 [Biomphalaria pfeifferi]|uniref:Protein kinase domain-containing protein n=1 Tax=Biomphalaria pfeifferi TaxID=112525 RepID=A0AAD8BPP3_BIOPF|nr:hypothetical protein Bpfe_012122 [Biomphalaria pfeifferi]
MAASNITNTPTLSSAAEPGLQTALTVFSAVGLIGCIVCLASKLLLKFIIPIAWKCCLICQDVAFMSLSLGLLLTSCYIGGASQATCRTGGFFIVFGVLDLASSMSFMGITILLIQNPSKMSHLSTFRWGVYLAMVLPQKVVILILSALPVLPIDYFDQSTPYPLACFPVRQEGGKGATFGAILFFIMWVILATSFILCVVVAVRFWAGPGTRVHASSPSLWQLQKLEQGRTLHKFTLVELAMVVLLLFLLTLVVYSNKGLVSTPQWVAFFTVFVLIIVHVIVSVVQLAMWSSLCCDQTGQKKEPHHRLKQLELIKTEGPGRVRLKASWAAGKGVWKQGLLKVYGPEHIKAWAQEIVVLGLLRKSHSASVLQCLWTSNSNPYYETMTLISGNIVASDSRLTCLELTSSGTLQDLLKKIESPLPDQCQRTIMHDIAEGLSYLHGQNVLHRNLTSAAVYLKGSVQQCLVMRAAVGDFEDAQIYGTFLTGSSNSTVSRKRFLYPDIRAYALVGIEMLARVCECKQKYKKPNQSRNPAWASPSTNKTFGRPYPDAASHSRGFQDSLLVANSSAHKSKSQLRHIQANEKLSPGHFVTKQSSDTFKYDSQKSKESASLHMEMAEDSSRGFSIDQNWKLQARSNDLDMNSDWREQGKFNQSPTAGDSTQQRGVDQRAPGITLVKEADKSSVFHHHSDMTNDAEVIEEDRFGHGQHYVRRNGPFHQAGYITSKTDDGREIFIPAKFRTKKSSAASSSGYGSGGGSTSISTLEKPNFQGVKQVYRSGGLVQPQETEVLDALPGMTESSRRGDVLLDELFKAKKDAEIQLLLESYDERVRRGELGANISEVPYGIIFKKPNTVTLPELPNYLEHSYLQEKQAQEISVSSLRPASASTALANQSDTERPSSAGKVSSTVWNPRSSIKRTKARTALKKALNNKEVTSISHLQTVATVRGARAKDIEIKYAKLEETQQTVTSKLNIKHETKTPLFNNLQETMSPNINKDIIPTQAKVDLSINTSQIPETSTQSAHGRKSVSKKRSTKSRPAPEPPVKHPTQPPQPHLDSVTTTSSNVERMSSFNSYDMSPVSNDQSSTSGDAGSTETESSIQGGVYVREQTSVEKIESDMNDIINSSTLDISSKKLPPGAKLIDSGFDSASVSSEESCLCAAAALQVVDEGSCSGPSEAFSQSTTCSCACSNCLGSSQRNKNSSSWTGSQDSESWSNSNSFSSYDVNMHRRKLPRSKCESPGCVLAPDEQYPSPAHRSHSFQHRGSYVLKRNHRRLAHTREHYTSSSSEASSAASRRYRELLKKGVAFRVSVIPCESQGDQPPGRPPLLSPLAEHLNIDTANNGFESDSEEDNDEEANIQRLSPIPSLEDIIKEIPDETGKFSDESRAFLNRPDSELSLKALQAVLSRHSSASEPKTRLPKELMIDRIFTHQGPPLNMPSNFGLRGTQDVDDSVIKEVAMLPSQEEVEDTKDVVGLLSGMDGRHIRYCHSISSRVSIVRMSDLLPANNQTFDKLVTRLKNTGSVSTTGSQILDLMRVCWLNEAPPTTTTLVGQLTDPVTETEL